MEVKPTWWFRSVGLFVQGSGVCDVWTLILHLDLRFQKITESTESLAYLLVGRLIQKRNSSICTTHTTRVHHWGANDREPITYLYKVRFAKINANPKANVLKNGNKEPATALIKLFEELMALVCGLDHIKAGIWPRIEIREEG